MSANQVSPAEIAATIADLGKQSLPDLQAIQGEFHRLEAERHNRTGSSPISPDPVGKTRSKILAAIRAKLEQAEQARLSIQV